MIASLPMYMRPETRDAYNRYWALIQEQLLQIGIHAPNQLSDAEDLQHWLQDDLVFSQTCGMPYRTALKNYVQLVGTPDFGLEGCPAGYYNSVLIVHLQDEREQVTDYKTAHLAVNSKISQSGYAAPQNMAKTLGFEFKNTVLSDAHRISAKMVANGTAEIAAIDAVTWRDIQRYDTFAADLKVIAKTPPTPGLPYICALQFDKNDIRQAVATALPQLSTADQDTIGIKALIDIPTAEYLAVPNP